MIQDPWKVLGVERGASKEDIKRAYRQKAKENHPDLHPVDEGAASRMNEINEAYDMLLNPQKYEAQRARQQRRQNTQNSCSEGGYSGGSGAGGRTDGGSCGYRGPGGWSSDFNGFDFEDLFGFGFGQRQYDTAPHVQPGDAPDMASAIRCVNAGRYNDAVTYLTRMPGCERGGRWYYVCAAAYYGMGDRDRALDLIGRAVRLEPGSRVYAQLYREYRDDAQRSAQSTEQTAAVSPLRFLGRVAIGLFAVRLLFGLLRMLLYGAQMVH